MSVLSSFHTSIRVLSAAALALAGAWLTPAAAQSSAQAVALPVQAVVAEQSVRVVDFEWLDTERNRTVPVRLYWPEAAAADAKSGKVPLVVFSHGLGGSRMGYSYLGRHWASQGFASLHVQHTGSDRSVWSGSTWERFTKLRAAASDDNALARAKDVSFAITSILADADFAPQIDAKEIAVAGHSYGANTALLLAGAQVTYQRKPLSLLDSRIKAAIIMSAPPFHGQGDMKRILASVQIPTLHLTGTEDNISVPGYASRLEDRVEVFEAVGASAKLLAVFDGGTHSIFTDRTDRAGPELNKAVKAITRDLSAAFLRVTLRGESVDQLGKALAGAKAALAKTAGALPGLTM
ncbi:MAG: alpha/beta hydrolase family protein [Burkholderiaceae bacterium]